MSIYFKEEITNVVWEMSFYHVVTKAAVLSPQDNPTVVVEDLRLCTVKHCEDIERRFCFEVVSPTK